MRRETNVRHSAAPKGQAKRSPNASARPKMALRALPFVIASAMALAGCDPTITKHGTQFHDGDLQQVQAGMTQEQVRMNLGSPSTTAVVSGNKAYYYISSTQSQSAFFLPEEEDRKVLAVYFTPVGTVERVANYGLKDGKVFDYVSRTTPAPGGNEDGIIKQLFRNLGTRQIFGE